MKQFTMEEIKGAKEEAKRFNIKVVGRKNTEVLDEVNAALKAEFEAAEAAKQNEEPALEEKKEDAALQQEESSQEVGQIEPTAQVVKSLQDYGFEPGEIAYITGRQVNGQKVILANRKIMLTKVSKKPGMFNGQLIHEKSGLPQKCEIAIPMEVVTKLQIEAPVEEVVEQSETQIAEAQ